MSPPQEAPAPRDIQASVAASLKPDLVLRVGFAGKRQLNGAQLDTVANRLRDVFSVIGWRLVEIAPMDDAVGERPVPSIAKFYSDLRPRLRLITGMCEGADAAAFEVFQDLVMPSLEKEFAAVVPFPIEDYRASRDPEFLPDFDRQLESCSYVLVPDGIHDKKDAARFPEGEVKLADRRRARAYRCQSALLLRQADLVVAVVDPDLGGKAGGTLETVRSALDFDLPVVLVHPDTGEVFLIEPGDDLLALLSHDDGSATGWQENLASWVTQITADPERSEDATGHASASHGLRLMSEFFGLAPPEHGGHSHPSPPVGKSLREKLWTGVHKRFQQGKSSVPSGPFAAAFHAWRDRASKLNGRYSGLYRGTYLLNHLLAVTAVLLAAFSLVLMGQTSTQLAQWFESTADIGQIHHTEAAETAKSHHPPWLFPILLVLAGLKLWIVIFIFRSTHAAVHGEWNDRAVDYRYLSERLRALNYLPTIGSFQPPAAAPAQYASRVVRQSAVDWLFDAIIRGVSPAHFAKTASISRGDLPPLEVPVVRIDPALSLQQIGDFWLRSQAAYHRDNSAAMQRFSNFLERWGKGLNIAVIATVLIDVLLVIIKLSGDHSQEWKDNAYVAGALLVFVAAVIPAAVAAFNGIRFQSECQRLAERSAVMHTILEGRPDRNTRRSGGRLAEVKRLLTRIQSAQASHSTNPGSWTLEALHLNEKVANDFVQEVAEWSVLYAKEIVEP